MHNIGRLWDQVAAEAGVTPGRAKFAVYVAGLAAAGRPLTDVSRATRRSEPALKKLAREFMIDFPDYRPFAVDERAGRPRPEPRVLLCTGPAE